jgi:hypothetical protein
MLILKLKKFEKLNMYRNTRFSKYEYFEKFKILKIEIWEDYDFPINK